MDQTGKQVTFGINPSPEQLRILQEMREMQDRAAKPFGSAGIGGRWPAGYGSIPQRSADVRLIYPPELLHPLSRRDEFAKAAMQALIAAGSTLSPDELADRAVWYADAMIGELGAGEDRKQKGE